jgi:hypothetical protein
MLWVKIKSIDKISVFKFFQIIQILNINKVNDIIIQPQNYEQFLLTHSYYLPEL